MTRLVLMVGAMGAIVAAAVMMCFFVLDIVTAREVQDMLWKTLAVVGIGTVAILVLIRIGKFGTS